MKNIAIFASGSGTNAENIFQYFSQSATSQVKMIFCNNPDAYVLERAKNWNITSVLFKKADLSENGMVLNLLKEGNIDVIVLAGFLWLIPLHVLEAFPGRIINIHPALLPKYGGKGMYGSNVHRAVIHNREEQSGITIHLVDPFYDEGKIIFQAQCEVLPLDNPDSLANKIQNLEQKHFPTIIEAYINENL